MKHSRRLPIVLTALLGIAASVGSFLWSASWARQVAIINFENTARAQVGLINSDLEEAVSVLDTLRVYFESTQDLVDRKEFEYFSRLLKLRSAGLRDTAWAPRVTAAGRSAFERDVRASGRPGFQIVELEQSGKLVRAGDRPEYYPVLYATDEAKHPVLGLDLAFEPMRRAVIDRAIRTGLPAASHPLFIRLVDQETGGTVLSYLPVYQHMISGDDPASPPSGLVFGIFDVKTTVDHIIDAKRKLTGLDLYFFDPAGPPGDREIYWRPGWSAAGVPGAAAEPREQDLRAMPHWEGTVALMDQTWGVLALSSAGITSGYLTWYALIPLGLGLLLTGMGTAYMEVSLRRTRQLEALTTSLGEMTSDLYQQTRQIERLARQDVLTELPNRAAFHEALGKAAARARRGDPFALLCLDLDRFKQVNDTLGHPIGDALLRAVADRLRALVRGEDTVARLGGDEFSMVQTGIAGPESAATLSRRAIAELSAPYDLLGHHVVIGVTIGIAMGPEDGKDGETLMRNADLALYRAKQDGRGVYRFFEPEMDAQAQERRQLEMDLREAVEREEFELHYQPLVSVETRRVTGFEALIRWVHPVRGLIGPGDFIPLAEDIGLIVPVGAWVLKTACREATNWPERVSVSVNLSPGQFTRSDIVSQVGSALRESGLAPERLELEITESLLRHDSDATLQTLRDLRGLGVRIAMDDFGSGYSALNYLRRFMFDRLKIHANFVGRLGEATENAAIGRAIAGMGRSLGIATTAEGVETEEQMKQLVRDGFTEIQGYLFAKPCPASDVPRLLVEVARTEAA